MFNALLYTLGQVDLRRADGSEIHAILSDPEGIALLVYLSAQPTDSCVHADVLRSIFWPKSDPDSSRCALRSVLDRLRQELGESAIEVRAGGDVVSLSAGALWCDFEEFDRNITAGDHEVALALFRGPFLEAFDVTRFPEFENWASQIRARVTSDAVAAAEKLSDAAVDEVIRVKWALCAADWARYDDWMVLSLLSSLAAAGEEAQALAAFERYRGGMECENQLRHSSDPSSAVGNVQPKSLNNLLGVECIPMSLLQAGPADLPVSGHATTRLRESSLPFALTRLVGRTKELQTLRRLLGQSRLVSVVGPGGIGKSRLVIEGARQVSACFCDGVAYVPLASLQSQDNLPTAIAKAIGLALSSDVEPERQIQQFLQSKQILLVLDNFEHLITGAGLLFGLLEAAPGLKILLSSRERLAVVSESVLELWGLSVPPEPASPDQVLATESAELFLQCVRSVATTFSPSPAELLAIALICRRLDGFPLGIELTAAWARCIDLLQIADELAHDPDVVTSALRAQSPRQSSLRAAFEHSWNLLGQQERLLLARLSVFKGSFSMDAASAVTGTTLHGLAAVCDKSLIRAVSDGRFEFPNVLRQYAQEKLSESPEQMRLVQQRHANYYLALPSSLERQLAIGDIDTISLLGRELENIRAAFQFSLSNQQIGGIASCAAGLYYLWETLSYFKEGYEGFRSAAMLERTEPGSVPDPRLILYQGIFALRLGSYGEASALIENAAAKFAEREDESHYAFALVRLGIIHNETGNFSRAETRLLESLSIYRAHADDRAAANTLMHLGNVVFRTGRAEEAEAYFNEALQIRRAQQDVRGIAQTLSNLALLLHRRAEHSAVQLRLDEALQHFGRCGDNEGAGRTIHNMGMFALNQGKLDEAEDYSTRSSFLLEKVGSQRMICAAENLKGLIALKRGDIDFARVTFVSSLKRAASIGATPSVLLAIVHLAEVAWKQGKHVQAMQALSVVLRHPSTDELTRQEAETLLDGVNAQPDSSSVVPALDECVEQLLQFA